MTVVTHGTLWACVNLLAGGLSVATLLPSMAVFGMRLATTAVISRRFLRTDLSLAEVLLVLPKDLFMSAIWLASFLGDTVWWSGRRFRILGSGEMEPLGGETELAPSEAMAKPS